MTEYDVTMVGAGPGGYVAAIRAAQLGLKVAIIDKQWMGGVCLNVGCIPSKALLRNAEIATILQTGGKEFGFSFDNLQLDYSSAVKRSRQVSNRLTKGVEFLMRKNKIDVHMGSAKLLSRSTVLVTSADGNKTEINSKNIIIATGAYSANIPGIEPDRERILTYMDAILQERLPKSVIIIGAGAIGVEFATIWRSYGVPVTIVEMLPRIVPLEDEEISSELNKAFVKRGIKTLTGYRVNGIEQSKEGVKVKISNHDEEQIIEAEQTLVAIGFKPNSRNIGLEELGVKLSERGFIEINDEMATNVPGIWAIGDVTGKIMLAHVASAQGINCVETIAGLEVSPLNYEMMPKATYCQPQVASFGLTEALAKERSIDVKVGRFPFLANGKALGLGDYSGWIKIITDSKHGEILGAHMIGPEVTELLPELTIAQMMELTAEEIVKNVHAHPTLSEALMEAAHAVLGSAIHV